MSEAPRRPQDAAAQDAGEALVARAGGHRQVGVEVIESGEEMTARVTADSRALRRQVWSTLPAGPYQLSVLRSSWDDDIALTRQGIDCSVIYQADAVRRPEMIAYLSEFTAAGAKVRVTARVTHRLIVLDRRIVYVATEPDTLKVPYLRIQEAALVHNFCAQFAATWRTAHSVGVGPEDSLAEDSVREILGILSSGVTDEVAARQLGVSTRTIRRRVAAVLTLLGAQSRFEAGAKAVQAGWI